MCVPQNNGRRLSGDEVSAMCMCSDKKAQAYTKDLLALSTVYTKEVFVAIEETVDRIKRSKINVLLAQTTQVNHLLTVVVTIILCFALMPQKSSDSATNSILEQTIYKPSFLTTFVYLMSLSLHFGAQIWMTFVSGLSLFFALPRHVFGSVQVILFPRYFTMNSLLSFVTLMAYLKHCHLDNWQSQTWLQATILILCFAIEFITRMYMIPPMVVLYIEKGKREQAEGVGQEVGDFKPGNLTDCPTYMKVHNKFRKIHMSIAMINMLAMAFTVAHLYYLAGKICIV